MELVEEIAEEIKSNLLASQPISLSRLVPLRPADLADILNRLTLAEIDPILGKLPVDRAVDLVKEPGLHRRTLILERLQPDYAAKLLSEIPADQRTDLVQKLSPHHCRKLLPKLGEEARKEVEELLKYPPDSAGGIMTTEFVELNPGMTVADALHHVRLVAKERESIYACYVLEPGTRKLLGTLSLRDLVVAEPLQSVAALMRTNVVSVKALDDRNEAAQKISRYNLLAVPVLEEDGEILGFVTVDDVVDVLVDEGTEDMLRMGAIEPGSWDSPYVGTPFLELVKKRAGWLVILFVGEMLTATAMGYFEGEISKAVVLALFVPLIISSGGNSGSQAATLIIRAMALKEIGLRDWWRVMRREILSGIALGSILGTIGVLRIAIWSIFTPIYGDHWPLVALVVGLSLVGVVLWGTLSGSMLPFILKRFGADPAASSAPFVATLVDVTGLVIYFTVAMVVLRGTLL